MKLAILCAALLTGCASPPKAENEACIPPQVQRQCKMEGGCTIISKAAMDELAAEIFGAGVAAGAQQCKGKL